MGSRLSCKLMFNTFFEVHNVAHGFQTRAEPNDGQRERPAARNFRPQTNGGRDDGAHACDPSTWRLPAVRRSPLLAVAAAPHQRGTKESVHAGQRTRTPRHIRKHQQTRPHGPIFGDNGPREISSEEVEEKLRGCESEARR